MRERASGGSGRSGGGDRTDRSGSGGSGGGDRTDRSGDDGGDDNRNRRDDARRRAAGVPVGELSPEEDPEATPEADADSEQESSFSIEDPDPPWPIAWMGQIGIYMGVVAVVLAVSGVTLAWLQIQPLGNVAIVFSLGLITVAMVLGMAFQAYVSDIPGTSE